MKLFLLRVMVAFLLLFLFACGITLGVIYNASRDLPNVDVLNRFEPYFATELYASDGELIGKIYAQDRLPLTWEDLPAALRNGVVATEDSRFYSHHGVDVIGVARAGLADLEGRGAIEGGSTITQQLARNLFLTPQVSLTRKIKEALLALEIERSFSKDEILLMYLNQVYFGAGAYGCQAAAQTFFGKNCKDLDLAQCALLAGLPQAPSAYNPLVDPEKAKERQREVLDRMEDLGYITEKQADDAYAEPLHFVASRHSSYQGLDFPYFTTYVIHELLKRYPEDLVYKGGLQVYTTLDIKDQEIGQKALRDVLNTGRREGLRVSQGALVAIEPSTGYIRAMIGGYRFSVDDQFNRAWQAKRQPGSAFKIFDYTAAIDNGVKPTDRLLDTPVCFPSGQGTWCPQEWDGKYWGPISVLDGLTWSRNTATVRMVAKLGIDKVIDYAHRMGIDDPLDPYLPTALGASVVTPLEMATAISTLDNEGIRVDATAIKLVKDRNGNVVLDNTTPIRNSVLAPQTADTMVTMMENVINHGTGDRARIGRPAAGKTGTTSDFHDAWFVGFTPELTCVVWTGNDNNMPMANGAFGGVLPATAWAEFMRQALSDVKPHPFPFEAIAAKEKKTALKMKNQSAGEKSAEPDQDTPPPTTMEAPPSPQASPSPTEESPAPVDDQASPAPAPSAQPDDNASPPAPASPAPSPSASPPPHPVRVIKKI